MSTSGGETRFSGDDSSDLSGGDVSLLTPVEEPTGKGEEKKLCGICPIKTVFERSREGQNKRRP